MTEINRQLLKTLREDINAALKSVAEKHGIAVLEAGNASFTANRFTLKLTGATTGEAAVPGADGYKRLASFDKTLPPPGVPFQFGRESYAIVGMRRTKLLGQRTDNGKTYLLDIHQVRSVWAARGAA